MAEAVLERLLRRDRAVVIAMLAALLLLAWIYLFWIGKAMSMGGMAMDGVRMVPVGFPWMVAAATAWTPVELLLVFLMWTIMMIGMMTPSAAPLLLIYARVGRQAAEQRQPFAATGWFAAGYLLAWAAFSAIATLAQWQLERASLLDVAMGVVSRRLNAAVLLIAGIYQWITPKTACLTRCRAPLAFIQHHGGFRRDVRGAVHLGLTHGWYCVGCCWMLMLLLFVGGVMNIVWIAMLAGLVLLEKVVPWGGAIGRIAGIGLVGAGIYELVSG
jgi:predicted metal-binding membrane protein